MKTITQTCQNCKIFFEALLKEVKRGNGKYCSKICSNESIKNKQILKYSKINQPNVECSYCKKMFYKNKHRQKFSKSGMFFCCREHKDLAQTLQFGLKEIQPTHFGTGGSSYREIAFRSKKHKCERCPYDKHPEILEVHHKDRDRENNTIENLEILCPNCHMEEHFLNKDGKWKIKTATSEEAAVQFGADDRNRTDKISLEG
jgi:hypothetical protein